MNKRVLVLFCVILAVGALLVSLLFHHSSIEINQAIPLPTSIGTSAPYGPNTIVFSNNRSFVSYNYITGKSKLLSPDNASNILDQELGSIDTLYASSDGKYILFHEPSINEYGTLYQAVNNAGYSTDSTLGYWFVYNVSSQAYTPLNPNLLLAKISGNYIYALTGGSGTESIIKYSLVSLAQLSSLNVNDVSNFYPADGGYVLQSSNNAVSFTRSGVLVQTIFPSGIVDGVSSDGQTIIATINNTKLVAYNLNQSHQKTISNSIVNQAIWSSALNEALYFTGSAKSPSSSWQLTNYNLTTNKTKNWSSNNLKNLNSYSLYSLSSSNSALVSQSRGSYYLIGSGLASIKVPNDSYSSTFSSDGVNSIYIQYSSEQNTMLVYWSNLNASQVQQATYQKLRNDGFDPNLLNIQFQANVAQTQD